MTPVPKGDWLLGSVFWLSAPAFLWGTYKYNRNTSEFIVTCAPGSPARWATGQGIQELSYALEGDGAI